MTTMKTPGVYNVSESALPYSVTEVPTAVPAFIGYTEKALNGEESLLNVPWKITSMAEFQCYFGGASTPVFTLNEGDTGKEGLIRVKDKEYTVKRENPFTLYYHLLLFFANGGGPCYIVSVGHYQQEGTPIPRISAQALTEGIEPLVKERQPTLLLIPEAVQLDAAECYTLQQAMLRHCGYEMCNRFAILDIYDGYRDRKDAAGDCIQAFREAIGSNHLDYAAVYYPWLDTSIVQESDLSFLNIQAPDDIPALDYFKQKIYEEKGTLKPIQEIEDILSSDNDMAKHKLLLKAGTLYAEVMKELRRQLNLLPPSAAMAGLYTRVDNTKGVWKAPANVSVAACVSPALSISHAEQEDLNVPLNGKSVNAIRFFTGQGILVWGARTLDGNSLDWRYINVRRTMIMLEESIRNAIQAYVCEPNVANTWISIKGMLSNFLNGLWKNGALAGAIPDDAYSIHVGLGETMTPEDILEGVLRVTVLVALVRPAEFIETTLQLQLQQN